MFGCLAKFTPGGRTSIVFMGYNRWRLLVPQEGTEFARTDRMKEVILIGLLAVVPFCRGFAETSREELMSRMGFSKEEIAQDAAAHNAMTGTLETIPGKSDPKAAASVLREATEVNKLRELSATRQQAENSIAEAEKKAALAKIKQQEAEEKAEVAKHETRRLALNDGVSAQTYADALGGRDKFVREAQEARTAAKEEIRKAKETRVAATAIIAKANAAEAKLERERLARALVNRDR
jgi:hypothetical protein